MDAKILFTDLDNTLLNSDKIITEGNLNAIKRMTEAGHKFVFATGRPLKGAYTIAEKSGLIVPGFYIACYNGGIIYDCFNKKVLRQVTLKYEYVRYLFDEAKKAGLHAHTYAGDVIIAEARTPEFDFYVNASYMEGRIVDDVIAEMEEEPIKVIIMNMNSRERLIAFQQAHEEFERGRMDHTFSCPQMLEYATLGVNKGGAVEYMCELLGVPLKNAVAVGDETNDISMIEVAGVGVCMANGTQETKACADYVTENDNNHDGIAEVIDKFIM